MFKFRINSEVEGEEKVEHDIVMVNIDGELVEETINDSEIRKEQQ